jgi:hypothetical protein
MSARELDGYGLDGWELCGIASTPEPSRSMSNAWPDVMAYTFKRPATPNGSDDRQLPAASRPESKSDENSGSCSVDHFVSHLCLQKSRKTQ